MRKWCFSAFYRAGLLLSEDGVGQTVMRALCTNIIYRHQISVDYLKQSSESYNSSIMSLSIREEESDMPQ